MIESEATVPPATENLGATHPAEDLGVTPVAASKIRELQAREGAPAGARLRISADPGGCSGYSYGMKFDEGSREDDRVFTKDGVEIVVDPSSLDVLRGTTLDYVVTLTKEGFKFVNPNATRTCGCGESFGV